MRPSQARLGPPDVVARPNWWVRLTSFGWDHQARTIAERELIRRSRLTSYVILALLVVGLVLLPLGINDPSSLGAVIALIIGLLVSLLFNRRGLVSVAGGLVVALICGGVVGALVTQESGLTLDALPGLDLLLMALVVAAFILPRAAVLWVGAVNVAIILAIYFLTPHASDLTSDVKFYGDATAGALALLSRPIALELIIGVVAYLARRSIDEEIRRADRAEEIASLEHILADQKRQLDIGVQQILQVHVRAANGDYTARAPLGQDNLLWQIASSLNNLLARLQRTGQVEYQLRRTEEELRRLALAIDEAQSGRQPIWPAPTGTAADLIIERITNTGPRRPGQPSSAGDPRSIGGHSQVGYGAPQQPMQPQIQPMQQGQAPYSQPAEENAWAPPAQAGNPWAFPQDN